MSRWHRFASATAGLSFIVWLACDGQFLPVQGVASGIAGGAAPSTSTVAKITISPDGASIPVGSTIQMTANLTDSSGNALSGGVVTWSSSNTAVATVSSSGLLSALASGSDTITATSGAVSGKGTVTVYSTATASVASVTVIPSAAYVAVGTTIQLGATLKDAGGNTLSGRTVTWASSNTAVAVVNGSGLVTGVAAGTDTITATSEGVSGKGVVAVVVSSVAEPVFNSATDVMALSDDFPSSSYPTISALASPYSIATSHGTVSLDSTQAFASDQSVKVTFNNDGCLDGQSPSDASVGIGRSIGANDTHPEWVASYYAMYQPGYMFWWSNGGCSRGVSAKELVNFYASTPGGVGKWSLVAHHFSASELSSVWPPIYQVSVGAGGAVLWGVWQDNLETSSTVAANNPTYPQHLAIGTKDPNAIADGAWHRITVRSRKQSGVDVGDGIIQMWVDGVLVMNYDGTDSSSPAYHKVYVSSNAGMYQPFAVAGIFNGGAPQLQSRWLDRFRFWRRPN